MKKILVLLIMVLSFHSFSQKKDKSMSFEEPQGWVKLLQLKNNNTFYFEFTKKEGINVMLFDSTRRKISSCKLNLKLIDDKLGYYILSGIYEIGGDGVIFFQKGEDRTPIMIRLIIDGTTGKLKSEEKVAELAKMSTGDAYAIAFGGIDVPDIRIVKDPESDYYALIRYNTLAAETKDRIEVFHYNPKHQVINKANYVSPNDKYKFTRYLNAYVHKDEYVVIGTYAFNTKKAGGEEARYYVSQLTKGKTTFTQKELECTVFYKDATCQFVYNNVKGIIHMIIVKDVSIKNDYVKYSLLFQNINPATGRLDKPYEPDFSKVNSYYHINMERKEDFSGVVQGTLIDKSGNLNVLYQSTSYKIGTGGMITSTILGDAALLTMSPEGKVMSSIVFPANIFISGDHRMFNSNTIMSGYRPANSFDDAGLASEQYFSMDLVATDNSNYVLFNNTPDNMELPDSKEAKLVKAISSTAAVKYSFKNNTLKKDYLFGVPKEKKGNEFCNFSSSSYKSSNKSYATLYTDPQTKKSALIWFKLE